MVFNTCKSFQFLPQLSFPDCEPLDVIYESLLLGVLISSDLSWQPHVDYITSRGTKNLWVLVRFKNMGGTQEQLKTVYISRIRSILEFAAPVFSSGLTDEQCRQLELIQKKAFAIILGDRYASYESALNALNLERLDNRRTDLCYRFALKCTRSPRHQWMFPLNPNVRSSSRNPKPFLEHYCRTARYFKSAIPYMARLLNQRQFDHQCAP